MICYEDIFPKVSRRLIGHGAELLIVSTNDAWFQEEGCAEQHASHSVLRAVEKWVPIVRWERRVVGLDRSAWYSARSTFAMKMAVFIFKGISYASPACLFQKTTFLVFGDQFAHICTFLFLSVGLYFYVFRLKENSC